MNDLVLDLGCLTVLVVSMMALGRGGWLGLGLRLKPDELWPAKELLGWLLWCGCAKRWSSALVE